MSVTTNESAAVEKEVSKINVEQVIRHMPEHLNKKEEKLLKSLRASKRNATDKLLKLYAFQEELEPHISKHAACRRGCSHCCHMPVSISEVEVKYIEKSTGIKRAKELISDIKIDSPCPFLEGDECSIYSSRPFACRSHFAMTSDNTYCKVEYRDKYEMTLIKNHDVELGYIDIVLSEGEMYRDIRQIFN